MYKFLVLDSKFVLYLLLEKIKHQTSFINPMMNIELIMFVLNALPYKVDIFFERQGSGKKPAFSCQDRHNNDTTEGLKLLGQWILNVAETGKKIKKKNC